MICSRTKSKLVASVLVSFCLATSWAQKQPDSNDADSAGIRHTVSAWTGAFNGHDPHACAQEFADDADMVSVVGLIFHGRSAIEDHFGKTLSTTLKNAQRTDTVKSIRFLSPDIASVDLDWEITGSTTKTADHTVIPLRKGLLALTFVKQNGQWLIAVSHELEFNVTSD